METKKIDRSIVESLRHIKKESLPNTFLKLYAKRRGKYKGWSDVRAETLPSDKFVVK
jgi:hypothetical protein